MSYLGHYLALGFFTVLFRRTGLFETCYGYDIGLAVILCSAELIPRVYRAVQPTREPSAVH